MSGFERRDKINYYLDLAEIVAQRCTCLRHHYGAVIVDDAGFTVVNVSDHRGYPNVKGFVYSFLAFY